MNPHTGYALQCLDQMYKVLAAFGTLLDMFNLKISP